MYLHPVFALIPLLAFIAVLGVSFAIVGNRHRKAWILVLPIVIAAWYLIEQMIALFLRSPLLPIFWSLALPVIVSIAARNFRVFESVTERDMSALGPGCVKT